MPRFQDIERISYASYRIDLGWSYLEGWLEDQETIMKVDFDPSYQRGYVWTFEQKVAYLEYILKGGPSGRDIFWNCPGWICGNEGPLEIVDGKQRINAVLEFLSGKLPVFGHRYSEYSDHPHILVARFSWYVNNLEDPLEVVKWYLDMNTGGSIHTEKDLEPAYKRLAELESERK